MIRLRPPLAHPTLPPAAVVLARCLAAACLGLAAAPVVAAGVDLEVRGRDGQPLADAVVYLSSDGARAAVRPAEGVQIAQQDKRFVPEVSVVPVGTAIQFPNLDRVRHHVYSLSAARPFELKLYAGAPANPVVFDRPGVAVLGCNIHDRMVAWVVVVETPHHGRSGADGRVRLDNVPPGAYTLHAWHPALPVGAPAVERPLAVPAAGAKAAVVLGVEGAGR